MKEENGFQPIHGRVIGVPVVMAVKTTNMQVSGHVKPRIRDRSSEAVTR
jgi:hypothetical protein